MPPSGETSISDGGLSTRSTGGLDVGRDSKRVYSEYTTQALDGEISPPSLG